MNDFEDIQRLIRLKRFEQPEEGFTENFLQQFHQRQRAEMLQRSSLELLRERVATWWEHLMVPKWSIAGAAAAVCAMSLWLLSPSGEKPGAALTSVPVVPDKTFTPKLDLSDIPLARMAENGDAAMANSLLRKHVEVRPVLEGNVLPANGQQQPSLQNVTPAVQAGKEGMLGK